MSDINYEKAKMAVPGPASYDTNIPTKGGKGYIGGKLVDTV